MWVAKYRYRIVTGPIPKWFHEAIQSISSYPGCEVTQLYVQPDHAHLIVMVPSQIKKVHHLSATNDTVHTGFYNNALPPGLNIDSGDTVVFETMNLFDDQVTAGMSFDMLEKMRQC